MRSALLLGALSALGAMAEIEPYYVTEWTTTTVTDWTIITITKTMTTTVYPSETAQAPETQVKIHNPNPVPEVPVETTTSVDVPEPTLASDPIEKVVVEPTSEPPAETAWTSTWASTWESTWTSEVPTTVSTAVPTSTEPATPEPTGANTYQSKALFSHNVHRSNHSASDLTWSADLEASAQVLASRCVYQHDTSINGGGYGQNIGYGVSADQVAVMISNMMYNDEVEYFANLYGMATPDMTLFEKWGHFSQIVWKGTTQVGCATVTCNSLGNVDSPAAVPFTVCNYSPPGNYDGEYAENISPPLGQAPYIA